MTLGSHPVRVRGLKHGVAVGVVYDDVSHSVRVRGLKRSDNAALFIVHRVAPRAGAWIETKTNNPIHRPAKVAPRAGAWIETRGA